MTSEELKRTIANLKKEMLTVGRAGGSTRWPSDIINELREAEANLSRLAVEHSKRLPK